jgi:hypothetical protein
MPRPSTQWWLAVLVTLASAYWQRVSGPTYPVKGQVDLAGQAIAVRLSRTHGGPGDQPVRVRAADPAIDGEVVWRRYPTADAWQRLPLRRAGDLLEAALPHQPPAGKLEYQVRLRRGEAHAVFPERAAVTRFKGDVAAWTLAPHVVAMFLAMLVSTRAGIGALLGEPSRSSVFWACGLLAVGGFVLGPAVQKQAFDAWWTGIPWGWDLTDNKTLLAGVGWAIALGCILARSSRRRAAVIGAALLMLVVFVIPHSVWGSQVEWDTRV